MSVILRVLMCRKEKKTKTLYTILCETFNFHPQPSIQVCF